VDGHGFGDVPQQLYRPRGFVMHDVDTVFIADCINRRIMAWKEGDTEGYVVSCGQGEESGLVTFAHRREEIEEKREETACASSVYS
jgi:hypothetical protein